MRPTLLRAVAAWPLAVALVLAPAVAAAAPQAVPGLFPTGVDAARARLTTGDVDPHWRVAASTDPGHPGPNAFAFSELLYPLGALPAWTPNTPEARWITLDAINSLTAADATFEFETTFDLTGFQPGTARLSIELASDDNYEVLLNGVTTTVTRDGAFTARAVHEISAGFRAGANVLRVRVTNSGGGPSGLFVQAMSAAAEPDGADPDGDGLSNYLERLLGTNPNVADTDGDGLRDGDEDANRNGVVDANETSPLLADTDGGGVNDGQERRFGTDPLDPSDDGNARDTDGDGVPDVVEIAIGTNPNAADTDGDGVPDGEEVGPTPTTPRDTDGDGTPDVLDPDDDGDGIPTRDERADAAAAGVSDDVDGDGQKNWLDTDADGDGRSDRDEGRGDADGDGVPNYLDAVDGPGDGGAADGGAADAASEAGGGGGDAAGGGGGGGAGDAGPGGGAPGDAAPDDALLEGGGLGCAAGGAPGTGTGIVALALALSALVRRRRS